MPRNWTRQLYTTEDKLRLWQYLPFMDMGDAASAIRSIQAQPFWRTFVPNAPVIVTVQKAKTWDEDGGVHRERLRRVKGGQEFVITYSLGVTSFGFTVHEVSHIALPWPKRDAHTDEYMRCYLGLWRLYTRRPTFDLILGELRGRGVPVEEFV